MNLGKHTSLLWAKISHPEVGLLFFLLYGVVVNINHINYLYLFQVCHFQVFWNVQLFSSLKCLFVYFWLCCIFIAAPAFL